MFKIGDKKRKNWSEVLFKILFVRHYRMLEILSILVLSILGEMIVTEVSIHSPYKLDFIDWSLLIKILLFSFLARKLFYFVAHISEIKHNAEKNLKEKKYVRSLDDEIINSIYDIYFKKILFDIISITISAFLLIIVIFHIIHL